VRVNNATKIQALRGKVRWPHFQNFDSAIVFQNSPHKVLQFDTGSILNALVKNKMREIYL